MDGYVYVKYSARRWVLRFLLNSSRLATWFLSIGLLAERSEYRSGPPTLKARFLITDDLVNGTVNEKICWLEQSPRDGTWRCSSSLTCLTYTGARSRVVDGFVYTRMRPGLVFHSLSVPQELPWVESPQDWCYVKSTTRWVDLIVTQRVGK